MKEMLCQDIYDALPSVMWRGSPAKHGATLLGPAAVSFLKSNGYMRCSRKYGIAVRYKEPHLEHREQIVYIPRETLQQLPHRVHARD